MSDSPLKINQLAADILRRLPGMMEESPLNGESLIVNLLNSFIEPEIERRLAKTKVGALEQKAQEVVKLEEEISKLQSDLWNVGWCPKCRSEIHHDMDEPFAHCQCVDGFGEATTVPIIPQLRFELRVKTVALIKAKFTLLNPDTVSAVNDDAYNAALLMIEKALEGSVTTGLIEKALQGPVTTNNKSERTK